MFGSVSQKEMIQSSSFWSDASSKNQDSLQQSTDISKKSSFNKFTNSTGSLSAIKYIWFEDLHG